MILLFLPAVAKIAEHHQRTPSLLIAGDLVRLVPLGTVDTFVFEFFRISPEILGVVRVGTSASVVVFGEGTPHRLVGIHEEMVADRQQMQFERNQNFVVIVGEGAVNAVLAGVRVLTIFGLEPVGVVELFDLVVGEIALIFLWAH